MTRVPCFYCLGAFEGCVMCKGTGKSPRPFVQPAMRQALAEIGAKATAIFEEEIERTAARIAAYRDRPAACGHCGRTACHDVISDCGGAPLGTCRALDPRRVRRRVT